MSDATTSRLYGLPKLQKENNIPELLQTDEVMVSFDAVSLFTKVQIQLALNIAKQHLQYNPELSQRTNFSTTNLIKGLEICLSSINFNFHGKHCKQVFGTAMGSPVSSAVANLVMEDVEKRTLETLQTLRVCGKG